MKEDKEKNEWISEIGTLVPCSANFEKGAFLSKPTDDVNDYIRKPYENEND
jgi:hypothetical protein